MRAGDDMHIARPCMIVPSNLRIVVLDRPERLPQDALRLQEEVLRDNKIACEPKTLKDTC